MKKSRKMYYLTALGVIFLLAGVIQSIEGSGEREFIYFGLGTLAATAVYYGIMAVYPQITVFLAGLIILHTGVLLIIKGQLTNPVEFGLVMFTAGIVILLNSGFSEFVQAHRKK